MKATLAQRRPVVEIECADLGGKIYLKPLDARSGLVIAEKFSGGETPGVAGQIDAFVDLIAASVYDPETNAKPLDSDEGRAFIASWGPALVMEVGGKAAEINGLTGKN